MKYRDINHKDFIFSEWEVGDYLDCFNHEFYHSYIYERFGLQPEVTIVIERKQERNTLYFRANGKCYCKYPIEYGHPKYYPKFILIEFIQFIYDFIYDIRKLRIRKLRFFRNIYHRLKILFKALRCLTVEK